MMDMSTNFCTETKKTISKINLKLFTNYFARVPAILRKTRVFTIISTNNFEENALVLNIRRSFLCFFFTKI